MVQATNHKVYPNYGLLVVTILFLSPFVITFLLNVIIPGQFELAQILFFALSFSAPTIIGYLVILWYKRKRTLWYISTINAHLIIGTVVAIIGLILTLNKWLDNVYWAMLAIGISYSLVAYVYRYISSRLRDAEYYLNQMLQNEPSNMIEAFIKDIKPRDLRDFISNISNSYQKISNLDLVTIGLTLMLWRQKRKPAVQVAADDYMRNFGLMFYIIFGTIAGLAITQSLGEFNDVITGESPNNLDLSTTLQKNQEYVLGTIEANFGFENEIYLIHIFVIISFFVVAIPFYHTAAIYLTNKDFMLRKKRDVGTIVFHFIVMLIEGALLFFMAININVVSVNQDTSSLFKVNILFVLSFLIMMIINVIWILYENVALRKSTFPNEWCYVNFLTILFLFWFLILYYNHNTWNNNLDAYFFSYLILLLVVVIRSIVNYTVAWTEVYTKSFGQ